MERDFRKHRGLEHVVSQITGLVQDTPFILASFLTLRGQDSANCPRMVDLPDELAIVYCGAYLSQSIIPRKDNPYRLKSQ